MVGTVRTAMGKMIDMNALTSANEKTMAVSPAGAHFMNARGDILGPGGKIVKTREDLDAAYAENIENSVKHVSISADNIVADIVETAASPISTKKKTEIPITESEFKLTPEPAEKQPSMMTGGPVFDEENIDTIQLEDLEFTLQQQVEPVEEAPKTTRTRRKTTTKRS